MRSLLKMGNLKQVVGFALDRYFSEKEKAGLCVLQDLV